MQKRKLQITQPQEHICSTSVGGREIKMKVIIKYHFSPTHQVVNKNYTMVNAGVNLFVFSWWEQQSVFGGQIESIF